jgi:transcription initiation factor TFIIIB Brf1 subunit/transcription initiation factor TFIIB
VKCPVCGRDTVYYDPTSNVYVCHSCGAVIDEHPVSYRPSIFKDKDRPAGYFTMRIADNGIGTDDALPPKYSERKLLDILVQLNRRLDALSLGGNRCIAETSAALMRRLMTENVMIGRRWEDAIDVVVFVACKVCGAVPPQELKHVARYTKRVMKAMNVARRLGMKPKTGFIDYVIKYITEAKRCVEIPDNVMATVMEIIRKLGDRVTLLTPMQAAYGALLLAFRINNVPFNLAQFTMCMKGGENPARAGARKIVKMIYSDHSEVPEQIKHYWKPLVSNERS